MKLTKYILVFLILTLTIGCSQAEIGCSQTEDYEVLATRIESQTAKQLKREKGLVPTGNSGQMMGNIKSMGLSFNYYHLLNLEEARELLLYASNVFLKNINENKEIRPYLHNYPFTSKNIELVIFIYQADGSEPNQGSLAVLAIKDGILTYELAAPNKYAPWPILHEETYETGLNVLGIESSAQ
jgi:hypothetical protein